MYARARSPTSPSSVAENSIVWRLARDAAEDPLDLRAEAHVEHPVGLVEDEDRDVVERDQPALDQVLQTARRRDDDLRALRALRLGADRRAAVDGGDSEALRAGELLELLGDLRSRARASGRARAPWVSARPPVVFSTIGIANASVLPEPVGDFAEHVVAGERVGQDEGLDAERLVDAAGGERLLDEPGSRRGR